MITTIHTCERIGGGNHHLEGHALSREDGEGAQLAHSQPDEGAAEHTAVDMLHLFPREI
jgi:hypothetical protein